MTKNPKIEDKSENSKISEKNSEKSTEKISKLFEQRKLLFENFKLNEEGNKFKEFEEVKISTKHELKSLAEHFKDFSENSFKEDSSEVKEFKLSENKYKRNSLDEYALLKARSQVIGENLFMKLRANSILKALEMDFNRKSFTCGDC